MGFATGQTFWDALLPAVIVTLLAAAIFPWLDRDREGWRKLLIFACLVLMWRYLAWRIFYTLPPAAFSVEFAVGIALGFFYRICTALFFFGFTYVELLDQTNYLNHYYLISLLSGLMVFLPANRAWSLDAWRKPEIRADTAPAWTLNLLRFQIGIVYVFVSSQSPVHRLTQQIGHRQLRVLPA